MRRTGRWIGVALGLGMSAAVVPSAGAQVDLSPDRDNTLYEELALTEGCSAGTSNGAGEYLFSGFTNSGEERRAVLSFDLSAIPPGSTVTAATLTLNLNRVGPGGVPTDRFGLRRLVADWGEGTSDGGNEEGGGGPATPGDATWCDRFFQVSPWASLGGDFVSPASATIEVGDTSPATSVWGSTPAMVADVQGWVNAPASNFGWILIQDVVPTEGADATARRFDSREGPAALQPRLSVTYLPPSVVEVPAVSTWGLGLLAALLLAVAAYSLRHSSRSR